MDRLFPKSPTRRRFDKNKVYIYAQNEEPFPCIRTTDCPLNCLCKNNKCFMLVDPDEDDLTTISGRKKYIDSFVKRMLTPMKKLPPRRMISPVSPMSPLSPRKFQKSPKKVRTPKQPKKVKPMTPMLSLVELERIQELIRKRQSQKRDKIDRKNKRIIASKGVFVPKSVQKLNVRQPKDL